MHEHSITNEVVHQIVHACEDKGITPKKIKVEIGELTTYKCEPVKLYFENFKKEYPLLKDAELEAVAIPGKIKCKQCKKISEAEIMPLQMCSYCDSLDVDVSGNEIKIVSIE